jgi:hypothetical protein
MAGIQMFSEAPNQISNQTLGWTSKTIYSYQNIIGTSVNHNDNVFDIIASSNVGVKGNYIFPSEYFMKPNPNQGRVIKITMHFYLEFEERGVDFRTGLLDASTAQPWTITTQGFPNASGGGTCYCKYEHYLNVYENSGPERFLQITGDVRFQQSQAGNLSSNAINDEIQLTSGFGPEYTLLVVNRTDGSITVTNLIVEEIG